MTKMPTATNRINPPITVPTISPTNSVVASGGAVGGAFSGLGSGAGKLSYGDGTIIDASPSSAFGGSGSGAGGLSYDHGTVVDVVLVDFHMTMVLSSVFHPVVLAMALLVDIPKRAPELDGASRTCVVVVHSCKLQGHIKHEWEGYLGMWDSVAILARDIPPLRNKTVMAWLPKADKIA